MPLVEKQQVAKWQNLRNLYDRTNSERNRWEFSTVTAPVTQNNYLAKSSDILQIRTLIDEMTGNSFLAEIANVDNMREIQSNFYLGFLENNQLSNILTNIEALTVFEDVCATHFEAHDATVYTTFDSSDCFTCPFSFCTTDDSSDTCLNDCPTDGDCPNDCPSFSFCPSFNGTFCEPSSFSNSSMSPTFSSKSANNPSCGQDCPTFTFAKAAAAVMTLSLDDEVVINDTIGEGGADFSMPLLMALASDDCTRYFCRTHFDAHNASGFQANACVGGFCSGGFLAAEYFNTL